MRSDYFRPANTFWRFVLNVFDFYAVTLPWKRIYYEPTIIASPLWREIAAHEMVHIRQIERHGAVLFSIKYLWSVMTVGYWDSPFEVEAREVAEAAVRPPQGSWFPNPDCAVSVEEEEAAEAKILAELPQPCRMQQA